MTENRRQIQSLAQSGSVVAYLRWAEKVHESSVHSAWGREELAHAYLSDMSKVGRLKEVQAVSEIWHLFKIDHGREPTVDELEIAIEGGTR
jgi:hypothetical protein